MTPSTRVLERISRVAPFGVRFWDDVAHGVVSDDLVVELYLPGDPLRRVQARPNRSGTFVAQHLPGVRDRDFEFGSGDDAFWAGLVTRDVIVEVRDTRGEYQPFRMIQPLPVRGVTVPPCLTASPTPSNVVPLFSTASRPVPAGMAVVRVDLGRVVQGVSGPERLPAAWAMAEVHVGGAPPVRGIADRDGRLAVIAPYPEPLASPARPASPPYGAGPALREQEWPVRLELFYEPLAPAPAIPDLCRTLAQLPAFAWRDANATQPLGEQTLRYGEELIIRSVVVTPAASPP